MEAQLDESSHNYEKDKKISGKEGDILMADEQSGSERLKSQNKVVKSTHNWTQSEGIRKESGIGESSPLLDAHNQPIGEAMGVQESWKEGEIVESQIRVQEHENWIEQKQQETQRINQDNQFAQQQHRMASSNKGKNANPDSYRPANIQDTTGRNQGSKEVIQYSMNRQLGISSKYGLHNNRSDNIPGNITLTNPTNNNEGTRKEITRIDTESGRQHEVDY